MNGYVGAADRYDWKLIGKQELYVPYNSETRLLRHGRLLQGPHSSRAILEREADPLRAPPRLGRGGNGSPQGKRHTIAQTTSSTWTRTAGSSSPQTHTTRRGQPLEACRRRFRRCIYEIPSCVSNGSIFYDLVAGRYVISPAFNEEKEADYLAGHTGDRQAQKMGLRAGRPASHGEALRPRRSQ